MNGERLFYFILEGIAFAGCATFVTWYHFSTHGRWRNNEAGVMLMMVYSDLAALLLWIMVTPFTIQWQIYKPITAILFFIFSVFTWWPLRMLVISQSKIKNKVNADD
jgi:hypothetical protein